MVRFPTLNLFIEGPDLSGKSSLIKELHSQTQYKRHIFDRSQISRKIFCDLYERDYELQHLHMEKRKFLKDLVLEEMKFMISRLCW